MAPRICLITTGHLASTPRLVKEADALHEAKYDVRVVASDHFEAVRPLDEKILAGAGWRCDRIGPGARPAYAMQRALQSIARRTIRNSGRAPTARLALRAHHPRAFQMAEAAAAQEADLYIGHGIAGLAAAGIAAARRNARLGFDAEDFHRHEQQDAAPPEITALEDYWIPRCAHRTASSPLIAEAYAKACAIQAPEIVLNVFPLAEAPAHLPPAEPGFSAGAPAKLYWFSQTIGPGRGLEEIAAVAGRLRTPVELHLRGLPAAGFEDRLKSVAGESGYRGGISILPLGLPAEMARLAAGNAIGLSLEQRSPPNRDLCLTNKIFTYLLAGLPVALTPTSAQLELAGEIGEAALVLDLSRPDDAARTLDDLLGDRERRSRAGAAAWRLAQTRFNWDLEKQKLLGSVRAALGKPTLAA